MSSELHAFVKDALAKNVPRTRIQAALKNAGWKPEEVRNALDAYADTDFPVTVPKRKPYLSAREAFMYLLMFLTLYWTAFSFGQLLYQFINRAYPDPLQYGYYDTSFQTIRMDTASIMIAFPVFLYVSWLLAKAIKKDPDKRASKIRKWLTYITLFIAAGIIIADLTALVFNALGGELTTRFLLKVLTVGAIAGSIFGYYLMELRSEEKEA